METEREDLTVNFADKEKHRAIYFIKDEAERKYKEFKNSNTDASVILYVGDFRPLANRGSNREELELVLPSEIFITVSYSLIFLNLLRVFDLDRSSSNFEGGSGISFTNVNTANLNRFRKDHPDSKLKTDHMFFELIAPQDETRMIIRTRFSDPITKEPLTEVWEAVKYKNNL